MDIIIVGAGGFGREVAFLIERINKDKMTYNILGFIDDYKEEGTLLNGYKVLGKTSDLSKYKGSNIVIAIANTKVRADLYNKINNIGEFNYPNLIDPSSIVSDLIEYGIGNIICANTILTVNIKLNNFVIVDVNATVGHDTVLGDYVTLYPNASVSGNDTLISYIEVGTNASIIQGLNIASNTIIGASSCVIRDIIDSGTYVGVPVRKVH